MGKKILKYLILILGIYFLVSTSRNLWRLWQARDLTTQAQQQVDQLQAENQQLQDRLKEVQTDEYVERQAREKLNLVKPGETIVIIPKELLEKTNRFLNPDLDNQRQFTNNRQVLPPWQQWWLMFNR